MRIWSGSSHGRPPPDAPIYSELKSYFKTYQLRLFFLSFPLPQGCIAWWTPPRAWSLPRPCRIFDPLSLSWCKLSSAQTSRRLLTLLGTWCSSFLFPGSCWWKCRALDRCCHFCARCKYPVLSPAFHWCLKAAKSSFSVGLLVLQKRISNLFASLTR